MVLLEDFGLVSINDWLRLDKLVCCCGFTPVFANTVCASGDK